MPSLGGQGFSPDMEPSESAQLPSCSASVRMLLPARVRRFPSAPTVAAPTAAPTGLRGFSDPATFFDRVPHPQFSRVGPLRCHSLSCPPFCPPGASVLLRLSQGRGSIPVP